MSFVVKNTIKWGLMDLICPYSCRGCGCLGGVLCECCKKHILDNQFDICPLCKRELDVEEKHHCCDCRMEIDEVFVGGWREGALAKLVADYKYQAVWMAGEVLVEIMSRAIPEDFGKDEKVIVVPLPTIGRHVRQRGIDHTFRLARRLARKRGWEFGRLLGRAEDTVQVGAKARERRTQAEKAYAAVGGVEEDVRYLLLDDVWTTGASALAAAKVMREAGAKKVAVVVAETGKNWQ